jgi:hypothetical protein
MMKIELPELTRLILQAVSKDHTPFESLIAKLSSTEHLAADALDDVVEHLLTLIRGGFVVAYLLHAEPPFITPALASPATIHNLWFLTTQEGQRHLSALRDADRQGIGIEAPDSIRCSPPVLFEIDGGAHELVHIRNAPPTAFRTSMPDRP